jgi:hypothetical protein
VIEEKNLEEKLQFQNKKTSTKDGPKPISPLEEKCYIVKQQDQMVKQNLTQDMLQLSIPGLIEPAGGKYLLKKPKLALRGGGRAYGKNS